MNRKSIYLGCVTAAIACSGIAAVASPIAVRENAAQLKADEAALQRQLRRLQDDQATLKADTMSGRMSAESKDAYAVYRAEQAVKGERKDIAADKAGSLQMKADEDGLHREVRRLELAEARLKADTQEGRMAAESADAERVYQDQLAVKAEQKQIMADKTEFAGSRRSSY